MRESVVFSTWLVAAAASGCDPAAGTGGSGHEGRPVAALAISNVTILDLRANALRVGHTVVVEAGRITAVGNPAAVVIPAGAERVDGDGAILMPALVDLHAHDVVGGRHAYLGHGIGLVRVMWGTPDQQRLAEGVERGDDVGPRMVLASPGHDGPPASWPLTRMVLDPADAAAAVARAVDEGWSYLKVYDRLSLASYRALVTEAARRGIPVVGHVPFAVDLEEALRFGQRSIEHLSGYEAALAGRPGPNPAGWVAVDRARMPALAAATAAAGVGNTPTLAITGALARRNWPTEAGAIVANRRAMVAALHAAGARLLVGSDAGIGVVAPGASLIEEIREFVAAGIPVTETLRMATEGGAEFLGRDAGVVAVGREASFVLLAADPRIDLSVLSRPLGMLTGGRWYSGAELAGFRTQ